MKVKKSKKSKKKLTNIVFHGNVILHPDGKVELDRFNENLTYNKYNPAKPITQEEWMLRYRPDYTLHKGMLVITK